MAPKCDFVYKINANWFFSHSSYKYAYFYSQWLKLICFSIIVLQKVSATNFTEKTKQKQKVKKQNIRKTSNEKCHEAARLKAWQFCVHCSLSRGGGPLRPPPPPPSAVRVNILFVMLVSVTVKTYILWNIILWTNCCLINILCFLVVLKFVHGNRSSLNYSIRNVFDQICCSSVVLHYAKALKAAVTFAIPVTEEIFFKKLY